MLDAEVARLPVKYRDPLILCYFQGRTHDEAAALLRWPVGTVRGRLARARDRLRTRLTRLGLAPSAFLSVPDLGLAPIPSPSPSVVPLPLIDSTCRAAVAFAPARLSFVPLAGLGLGGVEGSVSVPASAVALAHSTLRSLIMTKLAFTVSAAAAIATVGLAAGVASGLAYQEGRSGSESSRTSETAEVATTPTFPSAAVPVDELATAPEAIAELPDPAPSADFDEPSPTPPHEFSLPAAPPGWRYDIHSQGENPDGTTNLRVELVLDPPTLPDLARADALPRDSTPLPAIEVEATASIPVDTTEDLNAPIFAELPPSIDEAGVEPEDIADYLGKTRTEVRSSLELLTKQVHDLGLELQAKHAQLDQLRQLDAILNDVRSEDRGGAFQPAGVVTPSTASAALPDPTAYVPRPVEPTLTPFQESTVEPALTPFREPRQPAGFVVEPPLNLTPYIPPPVSAPSPGPADESRVQALESKLDRLLRAMEGLKNDVEALKSRDDGK